MADKPNYQKQLLEECRKWWAYYEENVAHETLIKFDWAQILHDFVKEVALDSFKNGIQAGIKRAGGSAPKVAPVYSKGTALKNGKLKPAERELVVEEEE